MLLFLHFSFNDMIRVLNRDDLPRLLDTAGRDKLQNPYFYIDAMAFGPRSAQIKIWAAEDPDILGYILQYYNTVQLFCCTGPDTTERFAVQAAAFLSEHSFDMISAEASCLRKIAGMLDGYKLTEGVIMLQRELQNAAVGDVICAGPADCAEIAALICSDASIGGHYQKDALALQLRDRMIFDHCRNLIVRKDGKVAAHFGTYAETDGVAVLGGLITAPQYRSAGLGAMLQAVLADLLLKEKKLPLLYCFDAGTQQWYEKKGWAPVRCCAKLERRK